jgi:hypothetical protein
MPYKIRSDLSYYRFFFIALLLLLGIVSIGTVALEHYAGIDVVTTESEFDDKALCTTLLVMGTLGIIAACMMLYLIREKRGAINDRRKSSQPFNYANQRSYPSDRRNR